MNRKLLLAVAIVCAAFINAAPAAAQQCPAAPSGSGNDCNNNNNADQCDTGGLTFILFDGSIKGVPSNDCKLDGIPDDCQRLCYGATNTVDADGDGVPNCQEEFDGTDPCDEGSRIERLRPIACGAPNGFFGQINIATVINTSFVNLENVQVAYFNAAGQGVGAVSKTLVPNEKWDVVVNDIGLQPDTYGTVCVITQANSPNKVNGVWTGGLTIYKLRDPGPFGGGSTFDYALYYPFTNPKKGVSLVPVNTNFPLNPNAEGTVANWIRLIDATTGDAKGLRGTLRFFDTNGAVLKTTVVDQIADGGRFDFGGHEALPRNAVGLAEFTPEDPNQSYYIESTRYFYEGVGATSTHFFSAFPIPLQPMSGAARSMVVDALPNEFSVVEILNGTAAGLNAALNVFSTAGATVAGTQTVFVSPKGTVHKIIGGTPQTESGTSWAQVSGPIESLNQTAFVYGFNGSEFQYGYSMPMVESAGPRQTTEFNTFIGHKNRLKLVNTSSQEITLDFQCLDAQNVPHCGIFDFNHNPLPLPAGLNGLKLAPRESRTFDLTDLPTDSYGTIVVRVLESKVGLVMVNLVMREGSYVMPFIAR